MTRLTKKWAVGGVALGALLSATNVGFAASSANSIDARLRMLEAEISKLRKEAAAAKSEAAAASHAASKATNVANAAHGGKVDPHAPPPPPPVYVTLGLGKGLVVETEDKSSSIKIGGRILIDGGGTAGSVGNGWNSNAGFSQARMEIEGKTKPWFFKLQYDFASTTVQLWNTNLSNAAIYGGTAQGAGGNVIAIPARGYVTDRNFLWGGFRDAYVGVQDPRLSADWLSEPVYFKIGNQFEPFSLEAIASSKYRDTIERPMAVDVIAPARHLGAGFGMFGKNNWTLAAGIYTLSPQDLNMRPVNTSSGYDGVVIPQYPLVANYQGGRASWYQPFGGSAYWETTGRVTWAPIYDEHKLVHIGASGSYHSPGSSTAYTDDRNMAPGNRLGSEANVLGSTYLGTTDLSCGRYAQNGFLAPPSGFTTYNASGNCVNSIQKVGVEAALSYNNFFVQGEWLLANYNRNSTAAAQFAQQQLASQVTSPATQTSATGLYVSPGNSHYMTTGGYVQGEWWITGEEKSQAYKINDKNSSGAVFDALKIKDPFSKGGWGAWGLVGRWSVFNLNNGPFSGGNINNALFAANNIGLPAAQANLLTNAIANSGIYGGYQQNVTAGINWYPDNGVAFQLNATHVMSLKSPLNWNPQAMYEGGSHPTFIDMRMKVFF